MKRKSRPIYNIISNTKKIANSIFTSVFDWFKSKSETNNPTKRQPRRPITVDTTEELQCNSELTKGLYHNSYPGMKLAGSMCYTPIATVLWLMGVPIPTSENEAVQKILTRMTEDMILDIYENHKQSHRDGTSWIYPYFNVKTQKVEWEFIQDEAITDIIKDIDTNQLIKIITDEQITLSTGYNKTATIRKQRIYTEKKVEKKYISGAASVPTDLKDKIQRNVAGILPIPFANNKDSDETRGHSDYERIVSDLKNYHDIDLKESIILTKFEPKLVQYVQDVDAWQEANSIDNIATFDLSARDLLFNLYEREDTKYVFPERAHEAYQTKLRNIFRKIVEGSGIPEILWGTKVEGNKASADQQMDMVVKLVEDKRIQKKEAYEKLFTASVALELQATMEPTTDYDIKIEWNNLDAISEETKSIIFKNISEGIAKLVDSAGATKEQLFNFWKKLYPNVTEDDYEKFKKGLTEMASHKQFKDESFINAADMQGFFDDEPDGNGNSQNAVKILQEAIKNKQLNIKLDE